MKLSKNQSRARRKMRIRKKISGTAARPRLVVFRSNQHIYCQLVDDLEGKTLASASTQEQAKDGKQPKVNLEAADAVGKDIAAKAKDLKIESVVFDRNGYIYHGRIKALADGV